MPRWRLLLWWFPALMLAVVAGLMPKSPAGTPDADFLYECRVFLGILGLLYLIVVALVRRWMAGNPITEKAAQRPGFPVIVSPSKMDVQDDDTPSV